VSKECKLEIEEDTYVESFRPHMMDIVYEWCNGCSFAKICKMSDIFEGQSLFPLRAAGVVWLMGFIELSKTSSVK
jgi:ATP-dependent RNA helicase DOB1